MQVIDRAYRDRPVNLPKNDPAERTQALGLECISGRIVIPFSGVKSSAQPLFAFRKCKLHIAKASFHAFYG